MPFYFHSKEEPSYQIFMGKDKMENEELIKYGWREDIWFHVDKVSSAHVYIRPVEPELPNQIALLIDEIPKELLQQCCQLVKKNSISGCKEKKVDIVYTYWHNLKKTADMEPGQVSFHRKSDVRYMKDFERDTAIVNKMEKTRTWDGEVELQLAQQERLKRESSKVRKAKETQNRYEKQQQLEKERQAKLNSYDTLFSDSAMQSNQAGGGSDSDDFM